MRVIAGSARRLLLKTIEGMDTRPTTDRIKETLFNMMQYEIAGSSFLDLFSGSGAIGIEALSRGARRAVFVEQNPLAVSCIQDNLETTHLKERALIMKKDVLLALKELEGKEEPFDFIVMDPPYRCEAERRVLSYLWDSALAGPGTLVIIEAAKETGTDWIPAMGWEIRKVKTYKTNKHIFAAKGEQ